MNRQIRQLGVALLLLFALLFARLNWVQVFAAEEVPDLSAFRFLTNFVRAVRIGAER